MLKTTLTAFALILTSTVASFADGCSGHSQQVMSCSDGMEYDSETGSCKIVSS